MGILPKFPRAYVSSFLLTFRSCHCQATTDLFSVILYLLMLFGILYKWSYTVYTVFCLVFHSAQLFWDSSCHCKYQYLIPLHCWVEFLCMSLPHLFRHSPVDDYLGHFHFFPIINTTAINIYIHIFSWTYAFISFGNIPRIKMLDHMRRVCLYFHKTAKLFSEVIV